ncbi:hypothetical protein ACFPRL_06790 [Pseudoclavibacter helvolus]
MQVRYQLRHRPAPVSGNSKIIAQKLRRTKSRRRARVATGRFGAATRRSPCARR